jgi:Fungal protein kinase
VSDNPVWRIYTNNDHSSSPGHAFLWKNHVEHGDPSVDNMIYGPESKCGVLTDFDLSLLQWEPRVFGTPFMAIDLLTDEYWEGTIKRYYHHELESFIWVIVCLPPLSRRKTSV